jgi:hypothetical protein
VRLGRRRQLGPVEPLAPVRVVVAPGCDEVDHQPTLELAGLGQLASYVAPDGLPRPAHGVGRPVELGLDLRQRDLEASALGDEVVGPLGAVRDVRADRGDHHGEGRGVVPAGAREERVDRRELVPGVLRVGGRTCVRGEVQALDEHLVRDPQTGDEGVHA